MLISSTSAVKIGRTFDKNDELKFSTNSNYDVNAVLGYTHPHQRFENNKIDELFPEHFNTIPRDDDEGYSSGPQPFKKAKAVPSVSY